MIGYTKLFETILTSTIWGEDDKTRLVWITILALKDRKHFVAASLPGLAHQARVSMEDCEKAIQKLSSPDPHSRSREHEGRRIEAADGGWIVLNGEKYRAKMNEDERREYKKAKEAEYRKRKKYVKVSGKQAGAGRAIQEGLAAVDGMQEGEGPEAFR